MPFREHFRDKKEWSNSTEGCIILNTDSDESAKEYDALVSQFCGWYELDDRGGFQGTIKRMLNADPYFLLGRALELESMLVGGVISPRYDESVKQRLDLLNEIAREKIGANKATLHELLHVDVANLWAKGKPKEASRKLEKLVTLFPEDVTALKLSQDTYFKLGTPLSMRSCLASGLSHISSKNPLRAYVHGMYSFALEESFMFKESQAESLKALSIIPIDTWAIHSYAHSLEMQGLSEEGLRWMKDRESDWSKCSSFVSHQQWHKALFHLNENQPEEAFHILDCEVLPRFFNAFTGSHLHDSCSLIYRMELINLRSPNRSHKNRWSQVNELCKLHKLDHLSGFNDAHYMMSYLGCGDYSSAEELISSLEKAPNMDGEVRNVTRTLLEAMFAYEKHEYINCVSLLEEIRFDIIKLGNSHAQRDVFEQLLVAAALESNDDEHNKLGHRLLLERDAFLGRRVPVTDLLVAAHTQD